MAGVVSKQQMLLSFHKLESDFFHRLVHDLAQDPTNTRWVMAFWLWLESDGHHDFIRRAYALPGPVVLRFVEEAVVCLRCLAGEVADSAADGDARVRTLPCTNALLAAPIDDVGYFVERRGEVLKGVKDMYRNVCLVVCLGGAATYLPGKSGGSAPPVTSPPARVAPPTKASPARAAPPAIRSPAARAAPPVTSSPACAAAPTTMFSPARAAQMMIGSTDRAAAPMRSAPGLAAQMMMSLPGHAGPLMMSSPSFDAQMMLMMSSPAGYDAQMMMMSAPAGYVAPLVMSTPALAPLPMPMPSSTLNPMATPWVPMSMEDTPPEEYRSLFITFSKGYPIAEEDILEFFNLMFGPCVETVTLQKVQPGVQPIHGRMVLRSHLMIPVLLAGQETAKFVIKGKHLWARVYFPNE